MTASTLDQTTRSLEARTFSGTWPYAPHFSTAAGFAMHYVDEGEGEVLLFLHGEPTWGYLFRHPIEALRTEYRVIAPDHMGFGKSETPADRTYHLQDHIDNLEAFVHDLDLRDVTLVMHDFGGPVGMGWAIRHPDRVRRIVSVNGPTPLGQPDLQDRLTANAETAPWFRWIQEAHAEGTLEKVLGESRYNILSTLKLNGFVDPSIVTDPWLEAYRAPFPRPEDTRGVIGWARGFATGAHQFEVPSEDVREHLGRKPALALWGRQDRTLQAQHFLPLFRSAFPHGLVHELDAAGHYSPEDQPALVSHVLRAFLRTAPPHHAVP